MRQPQIEQTARSSPRFFPRCLPPQLGGLLDRLQPSEQVVLIVTALFVGVTTGVGAVAFRYLIRGVEWVGYDWIPSITSSWGMTYVVLVPTVGGLLVGLLVYFFAREAKGHGVPEVMEAVALKGGRIRPIVAAIKSLASSICIGSGGSVGREGPIVQIGAALGSSVGQALRLSDDRVRNLVACGAAGGIAATFNAPIAGVIFALEIILHSFSMRYFSTVVISAVSASVIGQAVFGDVPAFPLPMQYHTESVWEFGLYPILGILAALTGVVFIHSLYWSEDLFARLKRVPEWVQPAIGGALLGGLALAYPFVTGPAWSRSPQIFNVGYDVIEGALLNQLVLGAVVTLLVLKLIATCLTLGSGGSGGIFAPSLFMGAMLGTAFGLAANMAFPETTAPPGAYALVGMAAVFAASAQAPITAILILFELTGDYRIILPLMLTVVVATLLARRMLKGESIYTLKLTRRGVRLEQGRVRSGDSHLGLRADDLADRVPDVLPVDEPEEPPGRPTTQGRQTDLVECCDGGSGRHRQRRQPLHGLGESAREGPDRHRHPARLGTDRAGRPLDTRLEPHRHETGRRGLIAHGKDNRSWICRNSAGCGCEQ